MFRCWEVGVIVKPMWVLEGQLYQSRYSKRAQRPTKCFLVNGDIFCGLEGQKNYNTEVH